MEEVVKCQMFRRTCILRDMIPARKHDIFTNDPDLAFRIYAIYSQVVEFCTCQNMLTQKYTHSDSSFSFGLDGNSFVEECYLTGCITVSVMWKSPLLARNICAKIWTGKLHRFCTPITLLLLRIGRRGNHGERWPISLVTA